MANHIQIPARDAGIFGTATFHHEADTLTSIWDDKGGGEPVKHKGIVVRGCGLCDLED